MNDQQLRSAIADLLKIEADGRLGDVLIEFSNECRRQGGLPGKGERQRVVKSLQPGAVLPSSSRCKSGFALLWRSIPRMRAIGETITCCGSLERDRLRCNRRFCTGAQERSPQHRDDERTEASGSMSRVANIQEQSHYSGEGMRIDEDAIDLECSATDKFGKRFVLLRLYGTEYRDEFNTNDHFRITKFVERTGADPRRAGAPAQRRVAVGRRG